MFLVCSKSPVLKLFNMNGSCSREFTHEDIENVCFLDVSGTHHGYFIGLVSKKFEWLYALGDDDQVYCFNFKSGSLDNVLKVPQS